VARGMTSRSDEELRNMGRRRTVGILAGGGVFLLNEAARAQFGFKFGSSSDEDDGPSAPGIDLNYVFSGLKNLFSSLTMGETEEIHIGETLYPRFIDSMGGAYRNRRSQTSLRNFAEDVFKTSGREALPWEVTILNNNTVNA